MTGDVLAALPTDAISLIALIVVVIGQVYQRRRDSDLRAQVGNVEHHVANTHDTNLRDDLDTIRDKVDDLAEDFKGYVKEDRAFRRDITRRMQTQERIADQHHPGER